jgi:hypothetical protein
MVRVVHAIAGGAAADLYADDTKLFSGIGYKAVTSFERVAQRQVTFKLKLATQPADSLAENKEMLSEAAYYTVVALPGERGEGGQLRVLTDEKSATKEGLARLRVVNTVADIKEIEVGFRTAKEPVVTGLNSADDVGYRDVAAATGILEVRDQAKKRVLAQMNKASLEAGKTYTLVVVGRATGTPKAEILLIEDGPSAATPTSAGTAATPGSVVTASTPAAAASPTPHN